MAVIFYLSSLSNPALPAGTTDKTWHAVGYAGLAVLVCRALAGGFGRRLTIAGALAAVAITAGYGFTDEFHQTFVPNRGWDVYDLVADAAGAIAGAIASMAWGIISPTSRSKERR
jgi:VanZ family protein